MQALEILVIFILSCYMDDGTEESASKLQWMLPFRAKAETRRKVWCTVMHTLFSVLVAEHSNFSNFSFL